MALVKPYFEDLQDCYNFSFKSTQSSFLKKRTMPIPTIKLTTIKGLEPKSIGVDK
jgi:hypothetical protein